MSGTTSGTTSVTTSVTPESVLRQLLWSTRVAQIEYHSKCINELCSTLNTTVGQQFAQQFSGTHQNQALDLSVKPTETALDLSSGRRNVEPSVNTNHPNVTPKTKQNESHKWLKPALKELRAAKSETALDLTANANSEKVANHIKGKRKQCEPKAIRRSANDSETDRNEKKLKAIENKVGRVVTIDGNEVERTETANESATKPVMRRVYVCNACDAVMSSERKLISHVKTEHRRQDETYLCESCGSTIRWAKKFMHHLNLCKQVMRSETRSDVVNVLKSI